MMMECYRDCVCLVGSSVPQSNNFGRLRRDRSKAKISRQSTIHGGDTINVSVIFLFPIFPFPRLLFGIRLTSPSVPVNSYYLFTTVTVTQYLSRFCYKILFHYYLN